MERDFEIAATQLFAQHVFFLRGRHCGVGGVGTAIPQHHRPTAVLALRNRALECVVVDWMIFDLHCKPFHRWISTRTLRNCPTLHDPIELEAKIEVEMTRGVLLNDEAESPRFGGTRSPLT